MTKTTEAATPGLPPLPKASAWLWQQHGWCVTAHNKHRAVTRHVDLCRPPVSTQKSPDFISLAELYTADQMRERDAMWLAKLNVALPASQQEGAQPVCETGLPGRRIHRWFKTVPTGTLLYSAPSPALPEGHVIAPKEPSKEMCVAGNDASAWHVRDADDIYRAMIAAAPDQTEGGEG